MKLDPSLLSETVTGLSVIESNSLSHTFLIEIDDELVATGSGFVYPDSCSPASFLVSVYFILAFVLVFNSYLALKYLVIPESSSLYFFVPFFKSAIKSYVS